MQRLVSTDPIDRFLPFATRSLPANDDLRVRLRLQLAVGFPAGTDDQPDEVVVRVLVLGNVDLPLVLAVVFGLRERLRERNTRSVGFSARISSTSSVRSLFSFWRRRIARVFVRFPVESYTGGGEGERLGSCESSSASTSAWSIRSESLLIRTRSWISCTCSRLMTPDATAMLRPCTDDRSEMKTWRNVRPVEIPAGAAEQRGRVRPTAFLRCCVLWLRLRSQTLGILQIHFLPMLPLL